MNSLCPADAVPSPSQDPQTVADAFDVYCQELTQPTWRSQGVRCPQCDAKGVAHKSRQQRKHDSVQRFLCNRCHCECSDAQDHPPQGAQPTPHRKISLIRTTVLRILTCGLGGPVCRQGRMNSADQAKAIQFLKTVAIGDLLQSGEVLNQGLQQLKVDPKHYKVYHYHLRKWIDWLREQGWLPLGEVLPPKTSGGQPIGTFKDRYKHRVTGRTRRLKLETTRIQKANYSLKESEMPSTLAEEIRAYRQFRRGLRPTTINKYIEEFMRFLGWQHRFEGVPLEDLTLAKLIPFVSVKPHHRDIVAQGYTEDVSYIEDLVYQQEALDQKARAAAQNLAAQLERYFEFHADCVRTQHKISQIMVYLAEFVYRDEIDRLGLDRQITLKIPVIKRLRDIQASRARLVRSTAPVNSYEGRSIPWRQVFDVLKQQQRKADEPYAYFTQVSHGKEYLGRNKRPKTAIARDMQTFLILLFFVAIPPDRVQGIQSLELGKTLIQGGFEAGEFIPIERMAIPGEAKWYVQLKSDQYKTGKSYGNYWGEVPNVPLGQGKSFYDYLDLWVYQHRPIFEPNHNFLFVKTQNRLDKARVGEPLTRGNITHYVRGVFSVYADIPVPPQVMRSMFATYLNQVGASEAELEAAAAAMHHSRSTQRLHYDRQDKINKVQSVIELNRCLFDSIRNHSLSLEALPLTEGQWVDYRCLTDQQVQSLLQQIKRLSKHQA